MILGGGKGTSNWLKTVPLADQEFVLNRNELTDAHNLQYYREMSGLPLKCPCRKNSNVTHLLNCRTGEFIHIRHDGLGDFNAKLLTKVQTDVEIEPALIPINNPNSSVDINGNNTADAVRADIRLYEHVGSSAASSPHFSMHGLGTPSPRQPLKLQYQRFLIHMKGKRRGSTAGTS